MSDASSDPEDVWFVRRDGKVTGPFTKPAVLSLRRSGRLTDDVVVSPDRHSWRAIGELEASADRELRRGTTAAAVADVERPASWFLYLNGGAIGPLTLAQLQQRADDRLLQATDPVWNFGDRDWTTAKSVPGLKFPPPPAAADWIDAHKVLTACIASAFLVLIVLPAGYVLVVQSRYDARRREADDYEQRHGAVVARLSAETKIYLAQQSTIRKTQEEELQRTLADLRTRRAAAEAALGAASPGANVAALRNDLTRLQAEHDAAQRKLDTLRVEDDGGYAPVGSDVKSASGLFKHGIVMSYARGLYRVKVLSVGMLNRVSSVNAPEKHPYHVGSIYEFPRAELEPFKP